MSIGSYGTIRPSDVSPQDVEIQMVYTPSRDVTDNYVLTSLDAQSVLKPYFNNSETGGNTGVEVLGGLYNLTLPAQQFNALGIYTLYVRPAQIRTTITDCGVLSALPNVKGIVVDLTNVPVQYQNKFVSQGLVGFRVEYLNADGSKIPNFFRVVTSCFFCEPVVTNEVNTTQKSIRYRYVDGSANLLFLTLSPSSSPTTKPNVTPYIGQPDQDIILSSAAMHATISKQMKDLGPSVLVIPATDVDNTSVQTTVSGVEFINKPEIKAMIKELKMMKRNKLIDSWMWYLRYQAIK